MEKAIEIKDLSFTYKDQPDGKALKDITLDVPKGEFLMILGHSGAGKSTLANCFNGLIPNLVKGKYEGIVIANGKNAAEHAVSIMARDVGLVFQDFENQLFSTNVRLEIAFSPENFSFPHEEMDGIIDEILNLIDLKDFDFREPSTLSGGQKQRIAIGSVLAGKPSILCMDEPTTDLDPISKSEVFKIAKQLRSYGEITLIVIEHETEEALNADRVLIMKSGEIFRIGVARDVLCDIQAFDTCGIMPIPIPKFFYMYKGRKPDILPLTLKEGIDAFQQCEIVIRDDRYTELLANDAEREKGYGELLIDVRNLSYTYPNGVVALDNINMQVRKGEFLAIVGHNGSGKTTLIKHFNGLLRPTEGSVTVCGKDTHKHSIFELGCDVGLVFQNPDHQIFSESIYDEVAFSPKLRGVPKSELKMRVAEALQSVDLDGFENEDPFSMSKGVRQRIAVASVLSGRPKVIILDEPTTGLDYSGQKKMMKLVKKLNERGHTVIMVTHAMWVVAEYAHRVAIVHNGKIIMSGSTREVFSNGDKLREYSLRTPQITDLSSNFCKTLLSIDEMLYCTEDLGG